jgi:hypothetical protein
MVLQQTGDLPSNLVIAFVAGLLAGMTVPLRYGMERLAGFSRALLGRLPYRPPPGREPEEALRAATEEAEDSPGDTSDDADAQDSRGESDGAS